MEWIALLCVIELFTIICLFMQNAEREAYINHITTPSGYRLRKLKSIRFTKAIRHKRMIVFSSKDEEKWCVLISNATHNFNDFRHHLIKSCVVMGFEPDEEIITNAIRYYYENDDS